MMILYHGFKIKGSCTISLWPYNTDAGKFFQVSNLNSFCCNSIPFPPFTSPSFPDKYKNNSCRWDRQASPLLLASVLSCHTGPRDKPHRTGFVSRQALPPPCQSFLSPGTESGKTNSFRGVFSEEKGGKTESWKLAASPRGSLLRRWQQVTLCGKIVASPERLPD